MTSTEMKQHMGGLGGPTRILAGWAVVLGLLVPVAALALALDARALEDGTPIWLKPLKFLASLSLFAATTAWALALTDTAARHSRRAWGVCLVVVACSIFELGYIGWQASQGEASHFNTGDRFHALMYSLMGAGAVLLTATSGVVAWLVARQAASLGPVLKHAVVLGFALTVVLGILSGGVMSAQPGHFVGHGAGQATWPLLGWSREAGDHRVAHFIGMHAQQGLPALGLLLQWPRLGLRSALGVRLVALSAVAWCGLVILAMDRAFRGQPFPGL